VVEAVAQSPGARYSTTPWSRIAGAKA